jgi:V8-like Glu-specific endopeptidase
MLSQVEMTMDEAKRYAFGLALISLMFFDKQLAFANENIAGRPRASPQITEQDQSAAQARPGRFFTDPMMLSEHVRAVLGISETAPMALPARPLDGKSHPFTTKNASAEGTTSPVEKFPWRAAGKMFMQFGASTYVCTASVIGKGLLVTAAHCVHNFGGKQQGFADAVEFEPARDGTTKPYGTWNAKEWWIPKVYFEGTDVCSVDAPGTVCENDVAVVVLEKKNGKFVADQTGKYGYRSDGYGYGNIFGQRAAQITQLGYPSDNYDGVRMVRTDSLGYQDAPNNVIIGSAQTGGSSGGPWLQNFGVKTSYTGTQPLADDDNQVVGTTSWGFTNDVFMVQGASRFGKNTTYTLKSNIQSLVDSACSANPNYC